MSPPSLDPKDVVIKYMKNASEVDEVVGRLT